MDTNDGTNRRARALRQLTVVVFAAACASATQAQTVYRCEAPGKVMYSHEPCVGAKAVDTTPTQGKNKRLKS